MKLYEWINLGVIIVPLLLSFDKKVFFFQYWKRAFGAAFIVAIPYLLWDYLESSRGGWGFTEAYAGLPIFDFLPLGEILFFFTVPFSCLFILEVLKAWFPAKKEAKILQVSKRLLVGLVFLVLFAGLAFIFKAQDYTVLALGAGGLACFLGCVSGWFWKPHHILYLLVSFVPFLVVNGILTSLPIVWYSDSAIWGLRIFSIPLEDFFYNLAYLSFVALVYDTLAHKRFQVFSSFARNLGLSMKRYTQYMSRKLPRLLSLIALALMYVIGIFGHWFLADLMAALTPFFLGFTGLFVLSFSFNPFTNKKVFWLIGAFLITFALEALGVASGLIFGAYHYGQTLGPLVLGVPPVIALNWILVVQGGIFLANQTRLASGLKALVTAVFCVAFDFIMEPFALGQAYWIWEGGFIPLQNYIAWGLIAFALSLVYFLLLSKKEPIISGEVKEDLPWYRKEGALSLLVSLYQSVFFITLRYLL